MDLFSYGRIVTHNIFVFYSEANATCFGNFNSKITNFTCEKKDCLKVFLLKYPAKEN